MTKGSGTRSGLLWEVERILDELKQDNIQEMPILLMENVPEVHSKNNIKDFRLWIQKLESLGYTNFCEDLNAKNYGIPQNRVRTFMISIPKECIYYFPKKKKLDILLKDLYIKNVDEKYFLKNKQINDIIHWKAQQDPIETMDKVNKTGIIPIITTRSGDYTAGMILIPIKNNTSQGYEMATFGDGINISGRMKYQRGNVQHGLSQTLTTKSNVGIIDELQLLGNATNKTFNNGKDIHQQDRCYNDNLSTTINTHVFPYHLDNLRFRRLIPKEHFRLMGVKDKDFEKIKLNQSDQSLYHLAGDSIVATCLMGLFGQLLGINWQDKFNIKEWFDYLPKKI